MPLLSTSVNGFWKRVHHSHGEALCISALTQARNPHFYAVWEIPDTLEGRFDCAVLHLFLLLRHVKGPLAQSIFDAFFSYTELTLREMGISDLKVGKQVKKCAQFFYGALKVYEDGLRGTTSLEDALTRNLYGNISSPWVHETIIYVRKCDTFLKEQAFESMPSHEIIWPCL